ncbi:MAG: hypothetical protein HUJ77_14430 [Clostridium sp.]|uniref:hypothetical protein n=1 Tax=Clostridium sp. TaxID=1506 RepID=UPI0025BB5517|nr:hypothetical protein [Clostridium sp.]MCF0149578.1 hypothetical protein [Clostridium sp.]
MRVKSKREKIRNIRLTILVIVSAILGTTLLISFNNYKETTKKIEVKESIRDLIITIKAVEINDGIEFEDSDTIRDIKNENGEKLKAIAKCRNIENFAKIEILTLEDARKILNDEVDFVINKDGEFLNIDEKK